MNSTDQDQIAAAAAAAAAAEQHLLFILLDSNLPTGGFISSSGLESYAKHGHLGPPSTIAKQLVAFARAEVGNYARASFDFVRMGWDAGEYADLDKVKVADDMQEALMLNHVARRSSKAQGVAMLTLFTKGLSQPAYLHAGAEVGKTAAQSLMDDYKKAIRRGEAQGHLNVCWGVVTAALGVSIERALHLHLFLHARSLLSSAVRLNLIGPYLSSQLLLHPMREIIEAELASLANTHTHSTQEDDPWSWTIPPNQGPATTWPLGELLTGRHDLQHTRIFNS